MNQPKFSVGDMVKDNYGKLFKIAWINREFDGFHYQSEINRDTMISAHENKLELYQEPKKKELYFWIKDGETEVKIFGKADRCPEVAPSGYSYYGRIALDEMKFHETPAD